MADEIPVVFQCRTCSAIVGDSMNMVHFDDQNGTISLRCVVNVSRGAVPMSSKEGHDAGNTFHEILCKQCKRILGKWYSATQPHFDAYRMMYTLRNEDLVEYGIGLGAPMDHWNMEGAIAVEEFKTNMESMDALVKRMDKTKKIVKVVEARLANCEKVFDARKRGQKRQRISSLSTPSKAK